MCVASAVCVDRLDARCRDVRCALIEGVRSCRGRPGDVCALGACADENGTIQHSEHRARRFARMESPVASARIASLVSDLLSLPVVHRHDDAVGG